MNPSIPSAAYSAFADGAAASVAAFDAVAAATTALGPDAAPAGIPPAATGAPTTSGSAEATLAATTSASDATSAEEEQATNSLAYAWMEAVVGGLDLRKDEVELRVSPEEEREALAEEMDVAAAPASGGTTSVLAASTASATPIVPVVSVATAVSAAPVVAPSFPVSVRPKEKKATPLPPRVAVPPPGAPRAASTVALKPLEDQVTAGSLDARQRRIVPDQMA